MEGQTFEKLNWLKAGFLSADKLLTVSPNYAEEITSDPEKGVELDDVIRCALHTCDAHSHLMTLPALTVHMSGISCL